MDELGIGFFASNFNLGNRLAFLPFFSKIPRGIGKISFDMVFYIGMLPRIHSKSLLTFFSIGNPNLNCVYYTARDKYSRTVT